MSTYEVVRSTSIDAEPDRVHELINDFHQWRTWSPWEDLDPDLKRSYTGPDAGVGAHYAWSGNRKAGHGSMEITGSAADVIDVRLIFLKPFSATNDVRFTLTPTDANGRRGTHVEWRMNGEQKGFWGFVGRFMNMDKLVGKDFEKGLAGLKTAAES